MSAQPPAEPPVAEAPQAELDDADDMRGFHFRRLMRKPLTWILLVLAVALAASGGGALLGAVFIAVGAAAAIVLVLVVVFMIADSAAEKSFFEAYAKQRGMTNAGRTSIPPATPLLRKGDDRYAERLLSGPLANGVDGALALYTSEQTYTDSDGNRQTSYYRYTLGMCDVPETSADLPLLYCHGKFGLRSLQKLEDAFRKVERVTLESEALDKRYEIFVSPEQDANWVRQLFSPTFIVWLTDAAPRKFAFELVSGTLCCFVKGHKKSAAELDVMRAAAAHVATRLHEEATE
ncbi:MAG: hypothetical protein U0R52_10695 [Solirubrobacterales bacterium]